MLTINNNLLPTLVNSLVHVLSTTVIVTEPVTVYLMSVCIRTIMEKTLPMSVCHWNQLRQSRIPKQVYYQIQQPICCTGRFREKHTTLKGAINEITTDSSTTVSITTDIWMSLANNVYLSVTANYITTDWQLKIPILATFWWKKSMSE